MDWTRWICRPVKSSCRVCGRAVDHKNRKALFSTVGWRDRIAERLLEILSGLTIDWDDLSDFACKKCIAALDKFTHIQTVVLRMKAELANTMMDTTLRNPSALWWSIGSASLIHRATSSNSHIPMYSPRGSKQQENICHHLCRLQHFPISNLAITWYYWYAGCGRPISRSWWHRKVSSPQCYQAVSSTRKEPGNIGSLVTFWCYWGQ